MARALGPQRRLLAVYTGGTIGMRSEQGGELEAWGGDGVVLTPGDLSQAKAGHRGLSGALSAPLPSAAAGTLSTEVCPPHPEGPAASVPPPPPFPVARAVGRCVAAVQAFPSGDRGSGTTPRLPPRCFPAAALPTAVGAHFGGLVRSGRGLWGAAHLVFAYEAVAAAGGLGPRAGVLELAGHPGPGCPRWGPPWHRKRRPAHQHPEHSGIPGRGGNGSLMPRQARTNPSLGSGDSDTVAAPGGSGRSPSVPVTPSGTLALSGDIP